MKKEYDFSKGVRGKFYRPEAKLNIPVYLDQDIADFIKKYAKKKNTDVETIVNKWLRNSIEVVDTIL
ncbi:hypothetical protein JXO59_04825 [candidate division KSB1 bacterium]|nr:hypothetical protein [candidate division KSB1 bacterium]